MPYWERLTILGAVVLARGASLARLVDSRIARLQLDRRRRDALPRAAPEHRWSGSSSSRCSRACW